MGLEPNRYDLSPAPFGLKIILSTAIFFPFYFIELFKSFLISLGYRLNSFFSASLFMHSQEILLN
jgi:hypothetical protein